jgi:hypothetical protein
LICIEAVSRISDWCVLECELLLDGIHKFSKALFCGT